VTDLESALQNLQQQAGELAAITNDLHAALLHANSAQLVAEAVAATEELESLHTALLANIARLSACIREPRGVG